MTDSVVEAMLRAQIVAEIASAMPPGDGHGLGPRVRQGSKKGRGDRKRQGMSDGKGEIL